MAENEKINILVKSAGMLDQLMAPGHYTFFAPSDGAFAAMGEGGVARLTRPANRDELVRLLRNHLLNQVVLQSDFRRGQELRTLAKGTLRVDMHGRDSIDVNGAHLLMMDLRASNGVTHVIDNVLTPPSS